MKRIIIHWTAGGAVPNVHEKNCYHYLVDNSGKIHNGTFNVQANEHCIKGHYAAHTGGGNTGSIGVALCGMYGFKDKNNIGICPITKIQFEVSMQLCAKLCREFNLPITKNTLMTHYEFGLNHPSTSSAGKIDIIYLPPYSWVEKDSVGDFIRTKVRWYFQKLN